MSNADLMGDVGEVITANALRHLGIEVLRNVYLPVEHHFLEIDMIGVCSLGLFVIENKNYSGVIEGSKSDYYWTVSYNFESHKLYNPIMQNQKHKDVVQTILDENNINVPIFSPVIFNDKATLNLQGVEKKVFTLSSFKDAYKSVSKKFIDDVRIKELIKLFARYSNISDDMKVLHKFLLLFDGGGI